MKSVCILGGGIAGLAVTKELHSQGISVDCYEMMPRVGGVFASNVWRGGQLTSSSVFTWYSDFPVENRQTFFTWEEMLEYLELYVDHFDFRDRIQLNSRVEAIEKVGEGWRVRVERANWSNGHPFHPAGLQVDEATFERDYDHVVICTGLHQKPSIPTVAGLQQFTGRVLHSSEYRDAEEFRDKRVVVVGSGESASDIALQLAGVSSECTISMRSAPGTLFPRWIQGNTPDIRDDRLTYNLPRLMAPLLLRGQRRFYYAQKEKPELFRWAADSNFKNNRCPFNTNACKSFGIPEAVIEHGATTCGPIERVEGSQVYFADGSVREADTILFGTGFTRSLPFLEPSLSDKLNTLDLLWKDVIHPELGDSLMMVGFSRPNQINLVTVAEMQARMIGQILTGHSLPSESQMQETIAADHAWMNRYYRDRYEKNHALVDYLYYMDSVARFIGCEVPLITAALRDPGLWFKLIFASMNGAHFRLVGPGSDWSAAATTIKATPIFSNKSNAIQRWIVLSLATLYAQIRSRFDNEWQSIKKQTRL